MRWLSGIWWNAKKWFIWNNQPRMLSLVKTGTSIFGNLVDGIDEEEWSDSGVSGDEWCKGVIGLGVGSGKSGGCDGGGMGLSSCCNFSIISAITDCWAARELQRMSKDSAWFFFIRLNESECWWTVEQSDSILVNTDSWRASLSAIDESCSSMARAVVIMTSVISQWKHQIVASLWVTC